MFKVSLSFCLILFLNGICGATTHAPQIDISLVSHSAQSIGTYTNGCVSGAVALPIDGAGYQVMRLSRQRVYGHPNLIQFIQNLGQTVATEHASNLLIGDLGQHHGGHTPSGHRSHQNGLDVDIWFMLSTANALSDHERETLSAPSMLASADKIALKEWTMAHERVLLAAAQSPDVERIFVNPIIKRELCQHTPANNRAALRKIRPWWKHDDHFHVRLRCPKDSLNCEHQEPLPQGDGCGDDLAWWFSFEATHPVKGKESVAVEPPAIPELCRSMLKN